MQEARLRLRALGPEALTGDLRRGRPSQTSAGVTAVAETARQVVVHAGARRGLPLLAHLNQHGGFDCPSCAWPDPDERSFAEFCENGAKAVMDAGTRQRLTPQDLAAHSLDHWATLSDRDLNRLGRLTAPAALHPGDDRYHPVSWDEAHRIVADSIAALPGPDAAVFYTSGRASNEAAFLWQLFARAWGTNNLPDCSNLCHESSGAALGSTIGIGKGTVLLEDFDVADVIVVIGQNPGTNHPRMLTALQHAAERGATIVSVNPLRETGLRAVRNPQDFKDPTRLREAVTGTDLASMFLDVRIGGDLALFTAVQRELLARDRAGAHAIDHRFLAEHTVGWDDLVAHLDDVDPAVLERESGIDAAKVRDFVDVLVGSNRIILCWAMGLTQHVHAVDTLRQLVNVVLLRGAIGHPGAGLCPVRGHSNVQGDRTVGIWDRPTDELLDGLDAGIGNGFASPREHGHDVVETIRALGDGRARALLTLGGNFLSAAPDTMATARGLASADLTVHITTKLNRSHLVPGATSLLLPCLARTDRHVGPQGEQFVSVEDSMGVVRSSRGSVAPLSDQMRSEPAIIAGLAATVLGSREPVDWLALAADHDRIRDLIEQCIPGFEDYNRRVRAPNGFALPNGPREGDFSGAPGGRARLTPAPVPILADHAPDVLVMMTMRSHDQFNTTVYDLDDRYRGIHGERRVVFAHAEDLAARGLAAEDVVDLVSEDGARVAPRFVCVPFDIPRGNCATYFPEANVLVDLDRVAHEANTPASKYVPIRLRRAAAP